MKLDVLVISAHPDDLELSCGGTVVSLIATGYKVGALDLTRGEMGTRGSAELRAAEAEASSGILGLSVRENAGLPDVFFQDNKDSQLVVAGYIRKYQPEIVIANAIDDRHPDHPKGARLASDACFIAGLSKVSISSSDGKELAAWRPAAIYHYIQSKNISPDFIVDISEAWETKLSAIKCFKSQFFDPSSTEPETYISRPQFLEFIEARCKEWGHAIGRNYGEGFTVERNIGIKNLFDLI